MKCSRKLAFLVMGVSSLALAACSDPKVDSEIYASVEQCINQSPMSDEECKANFAAAKKSHQKVAPKFKSQADCESEFGKERCEPSKSYAQSNGSSFFMPMMMGYMMSRMMGGGGGGMGSQPLYRGRNDSNFRTGDNKNVGARTGSVGVARSAAKAPTPKYESRSPNRRYATQKRSGGTTGSRSIRSSRSGLARSRSSSGGRFSGK